MHRTPPRFFVSRSAGSTSARLGMLLTTFALVSCGHTPEATPEAASDQVGVWTAPGASSLRATALDLAQSPGAQSPGAQSPGSESYLSDLSWTSATSAWGPVEKDRSNGEQGAADGRPLTIGGQVFRKGLGVHASSTLVYPLSGACTVFSASVGLDDEVGNLGSVNFQVYSGPSTVPLYDSGTVRGNDGPRAVSVNIAGVTSLRLVVTNGGDNIDYDHADWADARVGCPGQSLNAGVPAPLGALSYQALPPQPYGVAESQGVALNGKVYVFGGIDVLRGFTPTDRAYRYDPAQGSWTALATMPNRGITHAGMATDGTYIYYAGGYTADAGGYGQVFGTRQVWRYDPAQDRYDPMPDLPTEGAAGRLEVLDGQLHSFGGTNLSRTQDVAAHYVLNLAGGPNAWTVAAPLPQPRNHLGSVVLGGKIYALGGQTGQDDQLKTRSDVYAYDPAQDRWATLASLPLARGHIASSVFVLVGRIVVVGGETANVVPTADVSAYDPASDRWTTLTPLPSPRSSEVAVVTDDHHIFVTGGIDSAASLQAGGWQITLP